MPTRQQPVHIRRNIESYGDPYLADLKPDEAAVCRECHSVYASQRWKLGSKAKWDLNKSKRTVEVLCPACQKIRDRMPGGIVTLSGAFVSHHREEIVNLINHENDAAMRINPLERIMGVENAADGLVVFTTNEKLAQRLGRAMHKAYAGVVEYKWSEDTKLARVNWRRD